MNGFIKGVAIVAGSLLGLAVAYFVFRVADTWEKRNTDALVNGLGMGIFFLAAMLVVILAIILTLKMAIRNRQEKDDGDYYAPPAPRQGRQPANAYPYDYNVPAGQPGAQRQLPAPQAMGTPIPWQQGQGAYGTPYGQQYGPANAYGFAPVAPPPGQMSNQGAQYDLNGASW